MNIYLRKYLIQSSIITLLIYSIGLILFTTIFKSYYSQILIVLPGFFFIINFLIYSLIIKIYYKNPKKFTNYFLLTTTGKFFLYIIVIFLYLSLRKGDIIQFITSFLSLYIIFTFFETRAVLKGLKKMKIKT